MEGFLKRACLALSMCQAMLLEFLGCTQNGDAMLWNEMMLQRLHVT